MKKEDLTAAVARLRGELHSDAIVETTRRYQEHPNLEFFKPLVDNFVHWIVAGVGIYERLPDVVRTTGKLLKLDLLYSIDDYSRWIHYWTELQDYNTSQKVHLAKEFLDKKSSVCFLEAHRRIICLHELLLATLSTDHGPDELILEGLVVETDPSVDDIELVLKIVRELAQNYCECFYPNEDAIIRISYLDMGSNYQVGIKVDGKAEIGPNLNKFLSQIVKFLANPKSYIRSLNADSVIHEVEAFASIQARVTSGEITPEAGQLFVQRLLDGAKSLADQKVFPADLIKTREEKAPVAQLLELMDHHPVHTELPAPKLHLPPSAEQQAPVA